MKARTSTVISAWTLAALAGLAVAQPKGDQGEAPAKPARTGVLTLEKAGIDQILIAEKDQALKAALKMVPARLRELPGDAPEAQIPPQAVALLASIFGGPARVGIQYNPQSQSGGFFGVGAVVSLRSAEPGEDAKRLGELLAMGGEDAPKTKESKKFAGMQEITTPMGSVRMGVRRGGAGEALELHVGTVNDPEAMLQDVGEVSFAGVTPFVKARFDAAPLTPLLGLVQVLAAGDPAAASTFQSLTEGGVIGPDAAKIEWVLGHTANSTVSGWTIKGLGERGEKLGLSRTPLSPTDMMVVPADAHLASIGQVSMASVQREVDAVFGTVPEGREVLARFKEETGVDPIADVLAALNGKYAWYLSDSSGGGSLGSGVLALGLSDKAKLATAHKKLNDRLNKELTAGPVQGFVQVRAHAVDGLTGVELFQIDFPGLPVPIQPAYAIAGDWLVVGLTPQAAIAGARQALGKGDGGLMKNPAFAGALPSGRGLLGVSFVDSAEMIKAGYPLVTMFGSMVSNAVSSRKDGSRSPGLVVPAYADLARGARALVQSSYWDGADYVVRWEGDKSLLVNMAVYAGVGTTFSPVIVAVGAAAAAATEEMRHGHVPFPGPDDGDMDPEPMEPGGKPPAFRLVPAGEPAPARGG
jgi:hypothetical protein